jgi:serine/threonine-protein kinase
MVTKEKSTKPENTIISQSVEAGTTAEKGTKIDVEVSDGKGKDLKSVPFLIGKNVDEAKALIAEAGFTVGNIYFEESNEYPKNTVTSQQYKGGEELEEGTSITITISKGSASDNNNNTTTPSTPDGSTDSSTDNTTEKGE